MNQQSNGQIHAPEQNTPRQSRFGWLLNESVVQALLVVAVVVAIVDSVASLQGPTLI